MKYLAPICLSACILIAACGSPAQLAPTPIPADVAGEEDLAYAAFSQYDDGNCWPNRYSMLVSKREGNLATPANHHMTVSDRDGNPVRGKVVYLQPKAERWQPQSAVVHIVTSDWLDPYSYAAMYDTPAHSVVGHYSVHSYERYGEQWLFVGTFDVAKEHSAHVP